MKSLVERFREFNQDRANQKRIGRFNAKRIALRRGDINAAPQLFTDNDPALYNENGVHVTNAKLLPSLLSTTICIAGKEYSHE